MILKLDISLLVVLAWFTVIILAHVDSANNYLEVMQETLRLLVAGYLGHLSHIPPNYHSYTTKEGRDVTLGGNDETDQGSIR